MKLITTLFPNCTVGRGGNEANGLSSDAVPQNCEIIDHFHNGYHPKDELREHYLVKVDGVFVHLRICAAGCGVPYEAFAYIMDTGRGAGLQFYRMKEAFTS